MQPSIRHSCLQLFYPRSGISPRGATDGASFDRVLAEFETGGLQLDCGERDIGRVRQLIARYDDLPLGSADAFVAACAERNGARILTLDRRHFDVVGREL